MPLMLLWQAHCVAFTAPAGAFASRQLNAFRPVSASVCASAGLEVFCIFRNVAILPRGPFRQRGPGSIPFFDDTGGRLDGINCG